ncbi:RNA polymerase sigma factor [Microbacterium pseudoresistens]|uniref:RNA polymerase sigma-70 factor (ECF subfamily) n=1 Tax=Microbacterium pseudoresistens TaxID=640634 RepID=A0A7Y9JKX2_9MICO|nr:sigma-70 family RNA polymerase sigma factor [Microbacterium pseudoresistens]NYD53062.1 RNA polymerase sigma-70 factor (ECF subfamily) [Microbacterium pseudoresistens]
MPEPQDDTRDVATVITRTHREEWARIVAGLMRRFGDLDLAEEMTAEAFATAVERWPAHGIPPNPAGWVTTTANRRAIDRLRREARRDEKHRDALRLQDPEPAAPTGAIEDDRLRLLFICCHPELSLDARVALTLRIVGGLTVAEIAHAFLVQDTTMGQRISRAKAKIKAAGIPFAIPAAEDIPARIDAVLVVLYLVFNEGYLASGPDTPAIRRELTAEGIRLTRLAHELRPDDAEVVGLLALMLLTDARSQARVSADGELVRLDEQDRGSWDRELIAEGLHLLGSREGDEPSGRYRLLAEINAAHVTAPHPRDTDWARIARLYSRLEEIDPSPLVTLNKAIALSEHDSPDLALAIVDRLTDELDGHHAFHVTRAELLRATGRSADARAAYDRAIDLAGNTAETAHLIRRRNQLAPSNGEPS